MALLELSEVTRSMINLLRQAFTLSSAWTVASPPEIYPEPPSRLNNDALGCYLFHVIEDPHFKNFPAPGLAAVPVRHVPMALQLYYQLSANSALEDGTGALNEQLMMGIAMKALHDYPEITDATLIGGEPVFSPGLRDRGNRLKISLQTVPYNEAANYWTAGTQAVRLSAYYQVSAVLLEPEELNTRAARVLAYGLQIETNRGPVLTASLNLLEFTLPGEGIPRTLKLRPAQVPIGGLLTLLGHGFTGGRLDLLLQPAEGEPYRIGMADLEIRTAEILLTIPEEAALPDGSLFPVLPGIYSAQLSLERILNLPNGTSRTRTQLSNELTLAVSPRVDTVVGPDASGLYTLTGYRFSLLSAGEERIALELLVGSVMMVQVGTPPALGEFALVPGLAPGELPRIQFRLPAALSATGQLPLRLLANGVEAPPLWL